MSSDGANSDVHSLADLAPRGDPVSDLVRNNLDDGHPRVVLVALVNPVPEVAKPSRRAETHALSDAYSTGRVRHLRGAPVLLDLRLVLRDLRNARVRGPVRGRLVVERDVHVRVVLDLLELGGHPVRDEHQVDLVGMDCWREKGVSAILRGERRRTYVQREPWHARGSGRLQSGW